MADVEPNFRTNVGACKCGVAECEEYGTYRRKVSRNGEFCCKSCTRCPSCRGGANRLGGLRPQKKEGKNLQVAQKNSLGYGNEESAGIEHEWEHKSGGEAKAVFTAWNKHVKQLRARKAIGTRPRPELITYSMDDEPYSLRVYRSDQELDHVYERAKALGLI